MARRSKRVRLDRVILSAAKEIRKKKLDFEREASKALSEALGFLVVVKIQKQQPTAGMTPAMKKARRMTPAQVAEQVNRSAELNDAVSEVVEMSDYLPF